MSRICAVTGKRPCTGSRIRRRGVAKKSGGIGTHVVKVTKRQFRPNVQHVRVRLPGGGVRRLLVCARALKAERVQKV